MHILELHTLAALELRLLLNERYLPSGWNRLGDRQIAKCFPKAHAQLQLRLKETPDRLLARPSYMVLKHLARIAADKRTINEMVDKFVSLLTTLPALDQEDAYTYAKISDQTHAIARASGHLGNIQGEALKLNQELVTLGIADAELTLAIAAIQMALDMKEKTLAAAAARVSTGLTPPSPA